MTYVNRDGLTLVIRDLNTLILERYTKFHDIARQQLIWILREVLRNAITGSDSLIYNLLRQIAGGDVSPKNIWLTEQMLDLLNENRVWLERHSILLATVVYTFLRLIVDHYSPLYTPLRQREVDFCIGLLRERFTECLMIGRDLVRLLQDVARLPEFEALWRDITHNPTVLSPTFGGILSLLQTRTSRRFLQSRLTPDMERKINFLTSHVKFGQQKRFQDWFQRQYLSTPESQSLRCDLIRFICCVIHPTNEVLCSEIIPRWAVIGWILSSCTSTVAAANAKLALFYDWLFFDPERDNIMNIEPAILVMHYSLRTHPVITVTLLDFLCRITRHFSGSLAIHVRKGICSALSFILEKRVLPSLSALFDSPKIDRELRLLVRECFPEFCNPIPDPLAPQPPAAVQPSPPIPVHPIVGFMPIIESSTANNGGTSSGPITSTDCSNGTTATAHLHSTPTTTTADEPLDARFSDDDCETIEPDEVSIVTNHTTKSVGQSLLLLSQPSPQSPLSLSSGATTTASTATMATTTTSISSMQHPQPSLIASQSSHSTTTPHKHLQSTTMVRCNDPGGDLSQLAMDLPPTVRNLLNTIRSERRMEARGDLVNELLSHFWSHKVAKEIKHEQIDCFAQAISIAFHDDFTMRIQLDPAPPNHLHFHLQHHHPHSHQHPHHPHLSSLKTSNVNTPPFVIIRNLLHSPQTLAESNLMLCASVCTYIPLFGCLLLYFAHITSAHSNTSAANMIERKRSMDWTEPHDLTNHPMDKSISPDQPDHAWIAYKKLASLRNKSLIDALLQDFGHCQLDNSDLFALLLPDVFRRFASVCIDNAAFLRLIAGAIDSKQLQALVWQVMQGQLQLLSEDSVTSLVEQSLQWESFEQYCLWQLITAHSIPIDQMLSLLTKIDPTRDYEAALQMLFTLKQERPTGELLKAITASEVVCGQYYSGCLFNSWVQNYDDVLADLVCTQLSKGTPNKKRRVAAGSKAVASGSLSPLNEQLLLHLDWWRRSSPSALSFLSRSSIQSSLSNTFALCSDAHKSKFNDLFTLNDGDEDLNEEAVSRSKLAASSVSISGSTNNNNNNQTNNSAGNNVSSNHSVSIKGRTKGKTSAVDEIGNVDSETNVDQPPKSKKKKL